MEEHLQPVAAKSPKTQVVLLIVICAVVLGAVTATIIISGRGRDGADPSVVIDFDMLCRSHIDAADVATGTFTIDHPAWGRTTLVTCGVPDFTGFVESGVLAVDSLGGVWWSVDAGMNYVFNFFETATDASGNIFIDYNPGRYDGVMILRPTADSIQVLAGGYMDQQASQNFYAAFLVGPGADGLYEISQYTNDCTPDCASGTTTSQLFGWDGTTYVQR